MLHVWSVQCTLLLNMTISCALCCLILVFLCRGLCLLPTSIPKSERASVQLCWKHCFQKIKKSQLSADIMDNLRFSIPLYSTSKIYFLCMCTLITLVMALYAIHWFIYKHSSIILGEIYPWGIVLDSTYKYWQMIN